MRWYDIIVRDLLPVGDDSKPLAERGRAYDNNSGAASLSRDSLKSLRRFPNDSREQSSALVNGLIGRQRLDRQIVYPMFVRVDGDPRPTSSLLEFPRCWCSKFERTV
jgi:hypothetical protein